LLTSAVQYTAPKESENFVNDNNDAWRLFSVSKVFVIDRGRPAAIAISNEIQKSFGTVYKLIFIVGIVNMYETIMFILNVHYGGLIFNFLYILNKSHLRSDA
jgi:hypothetical protein